MLPVNQSDDLGIGPQRRSPAIIPHHVAAFHSHYPINTFAFSICWHDRETAAEPVTELLSDTLRRRWRMHTWLIHLKLALNAYPRCIQQKQTSCQTHACKSHFVCVRQYVPVAVPTTEVWGFTFRRWLFWLGKYLVFTVGSICPGISANQSRARDNWLNNQCVPRLLRSKTWSPSGKIPRRTRLKFRNGKIFKEIKILPDGGGFNPPLMIPTEGRTASVWHQLHFVLFSQVSVELFTSESRLSFGNRLTKTGPGLPKTFQIETPLRKYRLTTGSRVTVILSKHGDLRAAFRKEKNRTFIYCGFTSSSLVAKIVNALHAYHISLLKIWRSLLYPLPGRQNVNKQMNFSYS